MQKTILLVDDDNELRGFLKKLMLANNFKVMEAADGAAALEIVEKTPPDIVVLDFGLPKVPGETVCVEIKKNHPEIVVIALTGKTESADVVHGLQIGADDYMTKPFVAEELMARIRSRINSVDSNHPTIETKEPDDELEKEQSIATNAVPELNKLTFRESIVLVAIRLVGMELLFAFSFFLVVVLISYLGNFLNAADFFSIYLLILITLLIINAIIAFFIVLKWYSEFTEVTREGLMRHSGILHKKVKKYACNFVEIITLEQGFFGMIFNYGTLELYDPALKEQIYLLNIANPKKHSKTIEKIVSRDAGRPMPFVAQQ